MRKKSFNNVETDKNHQNIIVSKRRKIKENDQKTAGTKIYNIHQYVKKSKGNISNLYDKKCFSKTDNILFFSIYLLNRYYLSLLMHFLSFKNKRLHYTN